ncbi:MAG: hypothetical protein ACLFOY_15090 [Desulfatibacillaceae bacterium]
MPKEPGKRVFIEDEVDQLFADLGDVEPSPASVAAPSPAAQEALHKGPGKGEAARGVFVPGLIETLHEEESRMDPWRILLVEYLQELAGFIHGTRKGQVRDLDEAAGRLVKLLRKLDRLPDHDGRILIRHRGRGAAGEGRESAAYDYVVLFGPVNLDIGQVRSAAKRLGKRSLRIADDFVAAASRLSQANVANFHTTVSLNTSEERNRMRSALSTLGRFYRQTHAGRKSAKLTVLTDADHRPEPNLTILAAVSGLSLDTIQYLMRQVHGLMQRAGARDPIQQYTSIYDAVFGFRKLRDIVLRPPIEVNHIRWFVATYDSEALPVDQARLARLVAHEFADDLLNAARIMDILYADDFGYIDSSQLVERLGLATDLMSAIHRHATSQTPFALTTARAETMCQDVLHQMESRLERVPDEVLEELTVDGLEITSNSPFGKPLSCVVDASLVDLAAFFKHRALTRRKIKVMPRRAEKFSAGDYATIARDFGIEVADAEELVSLLRACFDRKGHFVRPAFEDNITAFCRHERHVFEFLWTYLKDHLHKEDRLALLNALQMLIDRMQQPQRAIRALMNDFLHDPEVVSFPDRNALMLTIVLLRKFNKELTLDIDQTPEEVLFVVEGLDEEATAFTRNLVDAARESFFLKVRTMHRKAKGYLKHNNPHGPKPLEYVLALEREVYILLSLIGGITAATVLRSALREYGNPDSQIYRVMSGQGQLERFWTILSVTIRGMGRVGGPGDVGALAELADRQDRFMRMSTTPETRALAGDFPVWVERAVQRLKAKQES